MRKLDLSSKEEYLAWVRDWKQAYKSLSEDIRGAKRRKVYHRDRARLGIEGERILMFSAYFERVRMRPQASFMLEMRKDGKELSWQKRCEAFQAELAASE